MNRIIKFRAWDNKRNRMYSTDEFHYDGEYQDINFSVHFPEEEDEATRWDLRTEDLVLLQFIGLLDKNGKEIYEGDIVKHRKLDRPEDGVMYGLQEIMLNVPREVKYEGCGFSPVAGWIDEAIKDMQWEVIGNIFEHPELIK